MRMTKSKWSVTHLRALSLLLLIGALSNDSSAKDIAPPDEPGPFNVGVTTFSAMMSAGRVTKIQVYYPTLVPPNGESRYTINTPLVTYQLSSPSGAVEEATRTNKKTR